MNEQAATRAAELITRMAQISSHPLIEKFDKLVAVSEKHGIKVEATDDGFYVWDQYVLVDIVHTIDDLADLVNELTGGRDGDE